jgi:hypothetical protein
MTVYHKTNLSMGDVSAGVKKKNLREILVRIRIHESVPNKTFLSGYNLPGGNRQLKAAICRKIYFCGSNCVDC